MDELMPLKGFNEDEWREAEQFAKDVAAALDIEYIGDVGEAGHEMPEWSDEESGENDENCNRNPKRY